MTPGVHPGASSVLETKAPAFSVPEAQEIARGAFGIVASADPLDSERDQNFQLRAEDDRTRRTADLVVWCL